MSVMIVTSLGDMVVDLHTDRCPLTCKNFLKLCKIKYYNGTVFHTVQKDFTAQTGDPTGTGSGGDSIYKFLYGEQARFFGDEICLDLKHSKMGTVAMASAGEDLNASQFYITLRDDLDYLDGKHTVFGEVVEGIDTLNRINEAYVDMKGRPFKNIRIKHTYVLDDPFDDPPHLVELVPDASPEGKPKDEVDDEVRLEDDWVPMDEQLRPGELEEVLRAKEAHSRAVVLESIGDIPDAEIKPPDNVLFVCKLNPVTEDEDLHTIFSRFGTVTSAEIIRDFKTNDSLCYAFIEFDDKDACEQAYFKMDNALIDDRRIHVDFSQSVSKLWSQYRRKGGQMGKGKGCFKCGSEDHIAKDCTGSPTDKHQPAKYILKDDSTQHGGDGSSKYEMVFDEDSAQRPRRDKRQNHHEAEEYLQRRNDERKERDYRKRDSSDRHRQSDRSKDPMEEERYHRSRTSPSGTRDEDYRNRDESHNRSADGNAYRGGRTERDYIKRTMDNDIGGDQRGERDSKRRSADDDICGDRREERDSKKRSADDDILGDRRGERDSKRRSADNNIHGDRRGERDSKKRSADDDIRGDRREDRDYKKSGDNDMHGERRYERDSKKRDADNDIRGDRRLERDYKIGSADNDIHRRDERDYKKSAGIDTGGDRRDERDSKKKSADNDIRGDRRDERDFKKRSGDDATRKVSDDNRRDSRHDHNRVRRH